MQPVCGKSGRQYGMAILNPTFGGPVFDMSLKEYDRDKFDIIGQYRSGQLWVPEFYEAIPGTALDVHHPDGSVTHEDLGNGAPPTIAGDNDNTPPDEWAQEIAPTEAPEIPVEELRKRAKAAGVWKKGMTTEAMKAALGEPV
jgi:hypothetical protein